MLYYFLRFIEMIDKKAYRFQLEIQTRTQWDSGKYKLFSQLDYYFDVHLKHYIRFHVS